MSSYYKEKEDDVGVALIFFARPDLLETTFEAVKRAKPKKLFLIQDGARADNNCDVAKIKKCREIAEAVDWECQVYKNYSEQNLGCGQRVYSGLKWAFEFVDGLLVVEDDCVPAESFFPFAYEMLKKYINDDRIGIICGMNNLGVYKESPNDYFFTTSGSIWGWATWKRVWDSIEFDLEFLQDTYSTEIVFATDSKLKPMSTFLKNKIDNGEKLSSWSFQLGMANLLRSQLNIVPKFNMICNIGFDINSANSLSSIKLMPRAIRQIYFMETHELDFPLKHPKYIVNDLEYKKRVDRLMGNGYPFVRLYRKIETIFYRIIYGDWASLKKGLKRQFSK